MHLVVLAGDGIGPEITAATLAVLRAASERFGLNLRIEEAAVGHAGHRDLNRRMAAAVAAAAGSSDRAALERLGASGSAYIGFAREEPHLFRLAFGPLCANGNDRCTTLRYGRSVTVGAIRCTMTTAGLSCRQRAGHHQGFFVSRQRYVLYR